MKKPEQFAPMFDGTEAQWARTQEIVTAVNAGAQYILSYLADIIPEVKDTDLWSEYDMEDYTD